MPFLKHFGLKSYPFGLTPDSALYFPSQETEAILAALEFALTRGDGLLKVVGEVGTGKTLLCRLLLKKMEGRALNLAYFNAPIAFQSDQMPQLIAHEFGLEIKKGKDPAAALHEYLLKEHAKGHRNVLIIDEAQALGASGLEAVRLLSNLETETDKLLQIVMFGQPELDRLLNRSELRQVLQRVSFSFATKPLSRDIVSHYVRFRLENCGVKQAAKSKKLATPAVTFSQSAINLLALTSGGLPRLIHMLADKALLAAYTDGEVCIERKHIRVACRETSGLAFPWNWIGQYC